MSGCIPHLRGVRHRAGRGSGHALFLSRSPTDTSRARVAQGGYQGTQECGQCRPQGRQRRPKVEGTCLFIEI